VARDEHRHVAFGARFLRDMVRHDPRYGDVVQRALARSVPAAEGVLCPPWVDTADEDRVIFGASVAETRRFATQALTRRLRAIGLAVAA
jgi:ribonucleoside-diphosphate reductase beta chain